MDGVSGREKLHGVDLNGHLPNQFSNSSATRIQEPEALAIMNWTMSLPFVLSVRLHAGAIDAVHPHDRNRANTIYYSGSPDDNVYRDLVMTYSMSHSQMHTGLSNCDNGDFIPPSITDYPVYGGGVQDWKYFLRSGCLELTIELGCLKYPHSSTHMTYWTDNKFALLVLLAQVHRALRGYVLDARTGAPIGNATITVQNNTHFVWSTDTLGEYWRLFPLSGMFTVWASKTGYFNSSAITINATELPFVRQSASEQWNFTLWPDETASWSRALDFDITLNRLPSYTFVPSAYESFRSASSAYLTDYPVNAPFVSALTLDEGSWLLGVQIAIVSRALRPRSHVDSTVWKVPGRIRIALLTGALEQDATSVEMGIRLLRHLVRAVHHPFVGLVDYLLSTQIVLIPYLDDESINKAAKHTQSSVAQNGDCYESQQDNISRVFDSGSALPEAVRQFLHAYEPHVLLTLETGNWQNHDWILGGRTISLPIKPIYTPSVNVSGLSMSKLMSELAVSYASAAAAVNAPPYLMNCSSTDDHASSTLHRELAQLLRTVAETSAMDQYYLPPIGLAIRLACSQCGRVLQPKVLPDLWHGTLVGLSRLFSAVHNLTFSGRLLLEHDPDLLFTADQSSKFQASQRMFGTNWITSPDAFIVLQSAAFFVPHRIEDEVLLDHHLANSAVRWLRVPVDPHTGLFAIVLPSGTYLAHASAGPSDSSLANQYEELTTAISLRSDQPRVHVQIGLERQLSTIEYHGLDDMIEHLRKLTTDSVEGEKCGRLRLIGQSRSGRPIHVFELGLGLTPLQQNGSFKFFDEVNPELAPRNRTPDFLTSPLSHVVLLGNLHGHDLLAPQLLVHFTRWLCENRDRNSLARQTLATVRLAVIPFPNPDGLFATFGDLSSTIGPVPHRDGDYCSDTFDEHRSVERARGEIRNDASVDLWKELIVVTENYPNRTAHWWWEQAQRSNFSASIEPELFNLIQWLRDYEPTAVLSLPSGSMTKIGYGVDPTETTFAKHVATEVYDWLRFLSHLLSPALRDPPPICLSSHGPLYLHAPHNLTEISALALALVSVSPEHAKSGQDLLSSPSFRPPLPLRSPISLGISLCPTCARPTPNGLALIWKSFRFPSLLLGLIGHSTLSAPGSSGLIGEIQSTTGDPVPLARIHFGQMRSELVTNRSRDHARFRIALPPGQFRVSIRAPGFVDRTELITIDAIRGPEYHVFRMIPLGHGSFGQWYTQPVLLSGLFCAALSCVITLWITYRHCYRPRLPYPVSRRSDRLTRLTVLQHHESNPAPDAAHRLLPIETSEQDDDGLIPEVYSVTHPGPTKGLKKIGFKKKRHQSNNHYVQLPQDDDEFDEVDLA